ncbi:unnamed protein product [Bursaphelenchus okinawaensis]|uniref:Uncharacterized protein n=1 Tax=Bursaphelenchus okinawaensis TaxID=465554 RepID=A0A811LT54_9BILA|nr:unnamed protein product [Bursaphelenchus okinawaensis]CAG9128463.1 unnamed protein product [Bursaphelenchus okinawaensis]
MQKLSLVLLAALTTAATANYCTSGSDFSDDCDNRQNNRGCLTSGGRTKPPSSSSSSSSESAEPTTQFTLATSTHGQCYCSCESSGSYESSGSDESSGSGSDSSSSSSEGSGFEYDDYCLLLQYFYNISIEITDVTIREAWIEFIEEIQVTIIYDVSLTSDEKLVAIWSKLEIFLTTYTEISELVLYTYIEEWSGYVFDIQTVVLYIQWSYTSTVVEIDASGDCILFEALRNCTAVDAEFSARIEILIEELTVILESTTYTYSYQLVLVYEKFVAFFAEYTQYTEVILEIEIEGYGSFSSFYEVVYNYWLVFNFEIAVGGSVSECELIQTLTACYENVSSGSTSERAQIKELVEKITTYYESYVEVDVRVEYFVEQFYEWLIIQEWSVEIIFGLEIQGYGTVYDLIIAYVWEHHCGCIDFGESTTTAAIETTTEVETTTHATGDCSTVLDLVLFQNNITDLSWSIDEAQVSWNSTEVQRFAAYEKRIFVVESNTTATSQEVFTNVANIFNVWTTNEFYLDLVYSINIYIYHETASEYVWGTVKQFCACA